MGSSSGKGGKQTQTTELPPEITKAAQDNLALAKQVGALPYAPYFGGSVAAFSPAQQAGFNNMNQAASAFGMQGSAGQGMPQAQNFGGIQGYSTEQPYKAAMAQVDPKILELYNSFFYPNKPAGAGSSQATPAAKKTVATTPRITWRRDSDGDFRPVYG